MKQKSVEVIFMFFFLVNYHVVLCGLKSIIIQMCHCENDAV